MKKLKVFCTLFLLFPTMVYAQVDNALRNKVIEETLYAMETKTQLSTQVLSSANESEARGYTQWFAFNDAYLVLGLRFGYLKGNTAYDFDHHTSELEFPMDNWMIGGNLSFGSKDLSFNTEIWTPVENYAGFNMKDKDWTTNGVLYSYTKSKAEMDAVIWDVNLRYDFYKKVIPKDIEVLTLLASDEIKIGALLGYRYERFDYDMYDLYYDVDLLYGYQGQTLYQGRRVLTYKIKYYLPYLGLVTDVSRKNWGISMNIKYSIYPTVKDVDNHLLRGLTFYGDYDKHREAFMGSIFVFWKFNKDWKLKVGVDGASIRIDGRTWEESRDPAWDKDQSTDTKQWIFWSGIEYKF